MPIKTAKRLTTDRQRELLRVIKERFSEFHHRNAHYYLGNGMSTSHILVHAVQDFVTLRAFWPRELIRQRGGGNIYQLEDNTLRRVQDNVRETLKQLEEKGHLEKIGNSDERRWKPTYREIA